MASIDAIEGMGWRRAAKLRKAGVRTTEALLRRGERRSGRRELARATGLSEKEILQWVNRADLMRVKGIGSEYADLLEAAGVDTVRELRRRNPATLTRKMAEINELKHLVRRLPTDRMVATWIAHAAELDPVVKY
jgi:predicted RecB family nuclease